MNFLHTMSKLSRIWFFIGLFIVGAVFTVFGVIAVINPVETAETTAIITNINREYDISNESYVYTATVTYTVDGTTYTGTVGCASWDKAGDTMTVSYEVGNPENVGNSGTEFLPYLILVLGVGCIVAGIVVIARGIRSAHAEENGTKTSYNSNMFNQYSDYQVSEYDLQQIRDNPEETKEYYFHWCGKLNQSYVLETTDRQAVFKADCIAFPLFRPYQYNFVNCETGSTTPHEISHTVTTSFGSGNGSGASLSTPSNSKFKIDGEDIWQHIGKMGYSIEPELNGIKLNFDVMHHGIKVARLEAAGANVAKGTNSKLGDKLPADGVYRVFCKKKDLEAVFVVCFTVSRVEFI